MGGNTIEKCNQVVTAGRDTIPVGLFMQSHAMCRIDTVAIHLIHEIAQQGQIPVGIFMQSHVMYQVGATLLSLLRLMLSCFVMNQPFDAETVSDKTFAFMHLHHL